MRCRGFLLFAIVFLVLTRLGSAQDVISIDGRTLNQHVDHRVYPVYPQTAKAARIQGTVVFQIQVGITGKIESMKVVSGPAMLQQAAIDCLKQWTYHPFEKDGKPVAVAGPVSLIFTLGDSSNTWIGHGPPVPQRGKVQTIEIKSETAASGPDTVLNDKFDAADSACKNGILSKQYTGDTVSKCQQAAMLADELPMDGNYIAKRSAYVYAASAYANIGDFKNALPWAIKAVDVVKLGHDGESGSSVAYEDKGIIEGNLKDYTAADQDLSVAEDYERKGIVHMEIDSPSIAENFKRILARDLRFHAKVLQELNRAEEAQKKLDEAAKLN